MSVLIVGAGIVGLSAAFWLAERGVAVAVVEQGAVPNPRAASCDHHRLIRYPYVDEPGYAARVRTAFGAWREMWERLGGAERRYYAGRGILSISQTAGDPADRARQAMDDAGVPYERIEGAHALVDRFPVLNVSNIRYGTLSEGGMLMANRILTDLAEHLRARGVAILEHSPVRAVGQGSVTLADGRVLEADTVVVAAGVGLPGLVPELEGTLRPRRSCIVYADPPEDLAKAWSVMPCWTGLGGDRDHWGMAPVDGLPLKLGLGALGRHATGPEDREMTAEEVAFMVAAYADRFRATERFTVRWHQANHWLEAPEERFFFRRFGQVVAVSADSGHGFKFGALSGRDVADALTGHVAEAEVVRLMAGLVLPEPRAAG